MAGERIGLVTSSHALEGLASALQGKPAEFVPITDWSLLDSHVGTQDLSIAIIDREVDWSDQMLIAREIWERSPDTTVLLVPVGKNLSDVIDDVLSGDAALTKQYVTAIPVLEADADIPEGTIVEPEPIPYQGPVDSSAPDASLVGPPVVDEAPDDDDEPTVVEAVPQSEMGPEEVVHRTFGGIAEERPKPVVHVEGTPPVEYQEPVQPSIMLGKPLLARGISDLFDDIADPMMMNELDENGIPAKFVAVNEIGCARLGYTLEELLELKPQDLDVSEDREHIFRYLDDLTVNGKATMDTLVRAKDGTILPVRLISHIQVIEGERMVMSIARPAIPPEKAAAKPYDADIAELEACTDELIMANERLQTEAAERSRTEERLLAAIEKNPIPTIVVLVDGTIISINPAAEALTGYTHEDMEHIDVWNEKLYPTEGYREAVRRNINLIISGLEPETNVFQLTCRDGTKRMVQFELSLFEGGHVTQMIDVTERTKAEMALRENEERYRTLFESSMDAVMLLDEKGFFDCNEATLRMFGLSSMDEFVTAHPADMSPPTQPDGTDSMEAADERIATAFEKGHNRFEWVHRRKDGTDFPAEVWLTAFTLHGKRVLQATVRDITERRQWAEVLKESEERYRTVIERSHDFVFILQGGRFVFCNDRTVEITGYPKTELIGMSLEELLHDEDGDRAVTIERQREENEDAPRVYEARVLSKDGTERHCEFSVERIVYEGSPASLGAVRDITGRRQAEQAMVESEERYRNLVEQSHDMVYIYQGDRFLFVNDRTSQITGYSKEELYDMSMQDLIHPDHRETVGDLEARREAGEGVPSIYEAQIMTKMENPRHCEFSVSRIGYGGNYATLGSVRDITLRRQAEEELRQHRDHLEEIVEERTTELRTAYDHVKQEVDEREKVEQELIKSTEKYQNLFDSALVGLYRTRISTGEIIECNAQLSRLFGYTDRELFMEDFRSGDLYIDPSARERLLAKLKVAGKVDNFETRFKRKDGTVFWGSLSAQIFPEEGYLEGYLVDITEGKWALEALQESELRYRSLFDNMFNGFAYNKVVTGDDGSVKDWVFLEVNDSFESFTGLTREEIIGKNATDVIPDVRDSDPDMIGIFGQVATTGKQTRFIINIRAFDRWFSVSAYSPREGYFVSLFEDITEAKQAEGALLESEERYRTLVETMSEGLGIRDENGVIIYVNERHCEILGYDRDEIIGRPVTDFLDEDNLRIMEEQMRMRKEGGSNSYEVAYIRKDGSRVQTITSAVPVYDTEGHYKGAYAVVLDIADLVTAESALEESQRALATLMSNLPGMAYRCRNDRERTMEFISEGCLDLTDHHPSELIGNKQLAYTELIHTNDREYAWNEIQTSLRDNKPFQLVYRIHTARGEERWVWEQGQGVFDEAGNLQALEGFITDTTERIKAEEDIRRRDDILEAVGFAAERFLETTYWEEGIKEILSRLGNGTDVCRVYIYENEPVPGGGMLTTLRYEWTGAIAKPQTDLAVNTIPINESRLAFWKGPLSRQQVTQGHVRDFPDRWRAQYMDLGVRSVTFAPIFVGHDWWGTIGFDECRTERVWSNAELDAIKVAADTFGAAIQRQYAEEELIIYRRHLEELVADRTAELEESNAELEAFAYSVSHDLRAPLRAMYGFSQALMEDYGEKLDDVGREYAQRIISGSERMDSLIQDLLVYSRLSLTDITPEPVELSEVVEEILEHLRHDLSARDVKITVGDYMPSVMGNPPTLTQVIVNLVTNAIKFVDPDDKPDLRIYAEDREDWVRIWVEDNGIGIAPEHQEQIFRVFERLHGSEEFPGTGIGLAIVRKGVARMNGNVGLESEVGKGSRFWFELLREE